jgi:hypothetical protein
VNYLALISGITTGSKRFSYGVYRTSICARFYYLPDLLGILSILLHPVGAIMVPVIAVNSWIRIKAGKGARWKGRIYNQNLK